MKQLINKPQRNKQEDTKNVRQRAHIWQRDIDELRTCETQNGDDNLYLASEWINISKKQSVCVCALLNQWRGYHDHNLMKLLIELKINLLNIHDSLHWADKTDWRMKNIHCTRTSSLN